VDSIATMFGKKKNGDLESDATTLKHEADEYGNMEEYAALQK
jgi:hypothetical protein